MRRLLFSAAVIVGVGCLGLAPAMATSLGLPGLNGSNINATEVEKVGYWRRMYRRYGYPGPYAYYPPAYSYYPPSRRIRLPSTSVWLPAASACVRLLSTRVWQSGTSADRGWRLSLRRRRLRRLSTRRGRRLR